LPLPGRDTEAPMPSYDEVCTMTARILTLTTFLTATLTADVRLPALISDHMLLQRDTPVRLWGKADPGEAVTIKFQTHSATAKATAEGLWEAWLPPMAALAEGAPLHIEGKNKLRINDVLVGEVWVGSGQSNMEWAVKQADNAETEMAAANWPRIRIFEVTKKTSETALDDVEGSWQLCSPSTIGEFTAVGYFFTRHLHQKLGVPFGFIQSAWGGTPVQAWTRTTLMESDPSMHWVLAQWRDRLAQYPAAKAKYDEAMARWEERKTGARPALPFGPGHQHTPGGLYNAMIVPLLPYAIKGVIWYQGEANASAEHGKDYRHQIESMIRDWRAQWAVGDFTFLQVQLANYAPGNAKGWPLVQEAQLKTSLRKTGMATIIDIGNASDIHPKNKQDVGTRLALAARHIAYGEQLVYSGPRFRQATRDHNALRVWLDSTGSGLVAKGGKLKAFSIAGADKKFHAAEAKIDGNTLLVSSPAVAEPVAVRYAFESNPEATLFNAEGLPASPFRSDDWALD